MRSVPDKHINDNHQLAFNIAGRAREAQDTQKETKES